ncbi:hypothetical protein, partial [Bacillus pumilus]|uniref:hypothetical protein n=1 Tax=Bacillus pumilus TaxID=1408 RepID=UPI001C92FBD9
THYAKSEHHSPSTSLSTMPERNNTHPPLIHSIHSQTPNNSSFYQGHQTHPQYIPSTYQTPKTTTFKPPPHPSLSHTLPLFHFTTTNTHSIPPQTLYSFHSHNHKKPKTLSIFFLKGPHFI